jgi:hypothetical protein
MNSLDRDISTFAYSLWKTSFFGNKLFFAKNAIVFIEVVWLYDPDFIWLTGGGINGLMCDLWLVDSMAVWFDQTLSIFRENLIRRVIHTAWMFYSSGWKLDFTDSYFLWGMIRRESTF